MWTGLADFIERLPTLIGKLSVPALVVGGALEIALKYGIVAPTAWDGKVAETAPILWVVGIALAVVWAILELAKLPAKVKSAMDKRAHGQQVRDNVKFLSPDACLLLYYIVKHQGGRTPNLDNAQAFRDLRSFGMLEMEWEFVGAFTDSSGTYRVSKALPQAQMLSAIAPGLANHFQIDLSDHQTLQATVRERLSAH